MTPSDARRALIRHLQAEHANEGGAARAYSAHARSVREPDNVAQIKQIELEELHHRAELAAMLRALGAGPVGWRDALVGAIGAVLGALCFVSGWLLPMLGACLLERMNTSGYAEMARLADLAGEHALAPKLTALGDAEADHEGWFRARVREHAIGKLLPLWSPAPRSTLAAPVGATPERLG